MLVYASVPVLRTIIDKKADLLQNGTLKVVSIDDETKEFPNDPVYLLLHKPNALQNKTDFMAQWCIMRDIYATSLIYKNKASRKSLPKTLWVLPSGEMKINPTGKLFEQLTIEDIIENYVHINNQAPNASPRYFEPNQIMRYVDGPSDRYYFGIPKVVTNKLLISNLQQALTTRNILLTDMGARGILSNETPDSIPIGAPERKQISKQYRNDFGNGEDQEKIIITNAKLKWQPISFPTKDLLAFEEVWDCFCQLCDVFGIQAGIFADTTASKAKDTIGGDGAGKVQEALKITYETTIQQTADEFCRGYNDDEDYGLKARGRKLICCYDHLPVMQEDQVDAENVNSVRINAASVQTTSLLALNAAVTSGQMEYDAAIAVAVNIHGIEEDIATEIILKPKKIVEPESDPSMTDEQKEFIKKYFAL